MSSILVPGVFSDASLPTDQDLKSYLASLPSLRYWMQADPDHVTQESGMVSSFNDVRSGSGRALVQASSVVRAPITPDATIGGYTSATFDGTSRQYLFNESFDATGTFSWVALARPNAIAQRTLLSNRTADTVQSTLLVNGSGIAQMFHRNANALSGVALPTNKPSIIIGVGTPASVKCGVGDSAPVVAAASGSPSTGSLYMSRLGSLSSSYWDGAISDVMIFDLDVYAPENAELLAWVKAYFRETYNLS